MHFEALYIFFIIIIEGGQEDEHTTVHLWGSEDNAGKLVLPSTFKWALGIELSLSSATSLLPTEQLLQLLKEFSAKFINTKKIVN